SPGQPIALRVRECEARRTAVIADVGRLDPASDEVRVSRTKIVDLECDRWRREVEVVRVVFHQLEWNELEGERLVSEADLHDRKAARVSAPFLDHPDPVDPELTAELRVVHIQHDVSDPHEA